MYPKSKMKVNDILSFDVPQLTYVCSTHVDICTSDACILVGNCRQERNIGSAQQQAVSYTRRSIVPKCHFPLIRVIISLLTKLEQSTAQFHGCNFKRKNSMSLIAWGLYGSLKWP